MEITQDIQESEDEITPIKMEVHETENKTISIKKMEFNTKINKLIKKKNSKMIIKELGLNAHYMVFRLKNKKFKGCLKINGVSYVGFADNSQNAKLAAANVALDKILAEKLISTNQDLCDFNINNSGENSNSCSVPWKVALSHMASRCMDILKSNNDLSTSRIANGNNGDIVYSSQTNDDNDDNDGYDVVEESPVQIIHQYYPEINLVEYGDRSGNTLTLGCISEFDNKIFEVTASSLKEAKRLVCKKILNHIKFNYNMK